MLKELLQLYLDLFQKDGESVLKSICNCSIPSMVVLDAYKKLPPIEQMPEKEKIEMKKYANELFKGETPEFRLNACKIIYTIGTLL